MRNIILIIFLVVFSLITAAWTVQAEQNPQEQLKQLIADLQKNPGDYALREKIIKHVQTMKPGPEISEEARRQFVRGNTALKDAKDSTDYDRAITRYNDALLIAPWWAEPYFNMANALELRERYDDAIASLKLYLLAAPNAEDARAAQDMIYALEEKKEKAQKETVEKKKVEEAKPDFSGTWSDGSVWRYKFLISGGELTITEENSFEGGGVMVYGTGPVDGRNFKGSGARGGNSAPIRFEGSLSEDDNTITISSIVAPEVADTQRGRELAEEAIRIIGKKWSTITWTRVSQ